MITSGQAHEEFHILLLRSNDQFVMPEMTEMIGELTNSPIWKQFLLKTVSHMTVCDGFSPENL